MEEVEIVIALAPWILPAATALLGSGTSMINSLNQRRQSQSNLSQQIAYNKEAAELAHERNLESWEKNRAWQEEMWHMSNTYNSPSQQMARLKEAGINPRLVYGSSGATGGMSSPTSSSAPGAYKWDTPDFSQVKPFQVSNGIGQYYDLKMKQAQIDAVEQQTSLNQQREANEAVNNAIKSAEATNARGYFAQRRQKMSQDAEVRRQQTELGKYNTEVAKEKLRQVKMDTQQKAQNIRMTAEQVIGQQLRNDFERSGLNQNTPYQAKILYRKLQKQGMAQEEILTTLLFAGVGADVLKTVAPASIIGKVLRDKRIPSRTVKRKRTIRDKGGRSKTEYFDY